jgi:hypothetical protein
VGRNRVLKFIKEKRDEMIIRTNVKAGGITRNHNEKMTIDVNNSIEQKKTIGKKLRLSKETIRELKDSDLKMVAGGATDERSNYCSKYC